MILLAVRRWWHRWFGQCTGFYCGSRACYYAPTVEDVLTSVDCQRVLLGQPRCTPEHEALCGSCRAAAAWRKTTV